MEIIPNDQGNRITPSYVAWDGEDRLVGDAAKNQAAMNPLNTVFDAKRLIGRKIDDPIVQADAKLWPFKIVAGTAKKPMIEVDYKGETKQFSSEEISAMVLQKMKAIAEAVLGHLRFPEIHSLRNPMKHKNRPNLKAVQPRGRPAPNRLQRVLVCRPTSSPNAK